MNQPDDTNTLQTRIRDLDARLLQQEHRWYHILYNFLHRKEFPKDDPRRKAASSALIWRVVWGLPLVVSIGTVGLGSVLALWLAWDANRLVTEQTSVLLSQNEIIAKQYYLSERVRFLSILYDAEPSIWTSFSSPYWQPPSENDGTKRMIEFEMDSSKRPPDAGVPLFTLPRPRSAAPKANLIVRSAALIAFAELERTEHGPDSTIRLPEALLQEIELPKGTNLSGAFLRKANLWGAILDSVNLRGAFLVGANLAAADFTNADLTYATLTATDLKKAQFIEANLSHANLMMADLRGVWLSRSDMSYCHGAPEKGPPWGASGPI